MLAAVADQDQPFLAERCLAMRTRVESGARVGGGARFARLPAGAANGPRNDVLEPAERRSPPTGSLSQAVSIGRVDSPAAPAAGHGSARRREGRLARRPALRPTCPRSSRRPNGALTAPEYRRRPHGPERDLAALGRFRPDGILPSRTHVPTAHPTAQRADPRPPRRPRPALHARRVRPRATGSAARRAAAARQLPAAPPA